MFCKLYHFIDWSEVIFSLGIKRKLCGAVKGRPMLLHNWGSAAVRARLCLRGRPHMKKYPTAIETLHGRERLHTEQGDFAHF
jgi:hypothetical protein